MKYKRLSSSKAVVVLALIGVLIATAIAGCVSPIGMGANQGESSEAGHSESGRKD